jgi:Sperm-tail PG-rich repeat
MSHSRNHFSKQSTVPQCRETKLSRADLSEAFSIPGPGAYNTEKLDTIEHRLSKLSKGFPTTSSVVAHSRFDQSRVLYCKEWASDHQQRAPYGPGHYETLNLPASEQVIQKKLSKKFTFPKVDRGLLVVPS